MAFFLLTRLLQSLVVCAILSVIVFFGVYMIGDPVLLLVPPDAGQEAVAHMRSEMGLEISLLGNNMRVFSRIWRRVLSAPRLCSEKTPFT